MCVCFTWHKYTCHTIEMHQVGSWFTDCNETCTSHGKRTIHSSPICQAVSTSTMKAKPPRHFHSNKKFKFVCFIREILKMHFPSVFPSVLLSFFPSPVCSVSAHHIDVMAWEINYSTNTNNCIAA